MLDATTRIYPALVPIRPVDPASGDQRRPWRVLEAWTKPFLTAFSDSDPITAGAETVFQSRIPGAPGKGYVTIERAGHNLQEDAGAQFAEHIGLRHAALTRPVRVEPSASAGRSPWVWQVVPGGRRQLPRGVGVAGVAGWPGSAATHTGRDAITLGRSRWATGNAIDPKHG
ncbi:MAG TPA: hypothetical protein VK923_07050 [Euzebyales bacterium]|nr:hypothetical protein [Euzebyales bacterium]